MNLSADLGEGAGSDAQILPFVNSASVGCGVHAGSFQETVRTLEECRRHGVEVGAHPGYPDRASFGRRELGFPAPLLESLLAAQVRPLLELAEVVYVKPHGALYHRCQTDPGAAGALLAVSSLLDLGLVAEPTSLIFHAGRVKLRSWREGYADRGYSADGSLLARGEEGAVLGPLEAAEQAVRLALTGDFDSICIHGDHPQAGSVARAVRLALDAAQIDCRPLKDTPAAPL